MILEHDAYFYRGEEAFLIRAGNEIPAGLTDHPTAFNGADPAKFDHDQDGAPGGSLPLSPAVDAVLPVKRGPGRPRKYPL